MATVASRRRDRRGDYMAFRMQTMYGSADATVDPEELVRYLEWCRWMRARAR